ncbi:DUF294 nucleotidyltransferase-like domain-containing protein [Deefgea piscis]|uniref:DUF294 nucleotidyltransferase-like domain-containing protein n=1 Tax=Deefgea piscis TaxID=2739061 RepID=UPI001C7E859E|nr:DUF294 nucleotidyltransferase-like domain-containing protein [Deefgea piscis]QZA80775.1 CBS domain-containing protein [Deefgea piscis]
MSTLFEFSAPPYRSLKPSERERFENALDIQYFASGHTVIAAGVPHHALLILSKGLIAEEENGEVLTVYSEHDTINSKAVLNETAQQQWVAIDDSIVFSIPRELILELIRSNPQFGAYFYQDIAVRMTSLAHQTPEENELQTLLLAPIKAAYLHPVQWLSADASILDAAQRMQSKHCTAVLIKNGEHIGIFTQRDLRDFVMSELPARSTAIANYAHYRLHSVADDEPIHAAMLLMTKHTISRVIVRSADGTLGILEQVDLLAFLTQHSHLIQSQIERAVSIDELAQAWSHVDKLIRQQQRQGVKVTLIADTMRELHRKLLAKTWQLLAPAEISANVCLLCLGSEGRGEQILANDQDNALIIADGFEHPDLAAICAAFNQALIRFGYPPCPGQIMVNNPYWRRSESEFRILLDEWQVQTHRENMLHLAIWLDAYPVYGNKALFARLRDYFYQGLVENDSLLAHFALPIEQFDTPLGFFSQLRSKGGLLDLKKGGIFTLVHGIRSLALKAKLSERNTYRRIEILKQKEILSPTLASDIRESLAYLQSLQLKYGLIKAQQGKLLDYGIELAQLTTLERDLLKDTLTVVKRFKQTIAHQFKLNTL